MNQLTYELLLVTFGLENKGDVLALYNFLVNGNGTMAQEEKLKLKNKIVSIVRSSPTKTEPFSWLDFEFILNLNLTA